MSENYDFSVEKRSSSYSALFRPVFTALIVLFTLGGLVAFQQYEIESLKTQLARSSRSNELEATKVSLREFSTTLDATKKANEDLSKRVADLERRFKSTSGTTAPQGQMVPNVKSEQTKKGKKGSKR